MNGKAIAVIEKPIVVIAMLASEKLRSPKSRSGSSGSLVLRACHQMNAPRTSRPARDEQGHGQDAGDRAPVVGLPLLDAEDEQEHPDRRERHAEPVEAVAVGLEPRHESGCEHEARPRPTGTLMKKIHSQPGPSTSTPPTIGPTRIATPAVAPHSAIA